MKVHEILPLCLPSRWAELAPCFSDASEFSFGTLSANDILQRALKRQCRIVEFVNDDNHVIGACSFSMAAHVAVVEYIGPAKPLSSDAYIEIRTMLEFYNGGYDGILHDSMRQFGEIVKSYGATTITARTRPSLARLWSKLGVHVIYSVVEFKLLE